MCAFEGVKGKKWDINKSEDYNHGTQIWERGLNCGCMMEIASQNSLKSLLDVIVPQVNLNHQKQSKV